MSQPLPPHSRTAEQQASVRRRAFPVAACALILGVAGLAMLFGQAAGATHVPPFLGINLCFCAMMMGIGIIFYARGTPRTGLAAIFCLLAILIGFAGTMVFIREAVYYRKSAEEGELTNLSAIANAARDYAAVNGGVYPLDLKVLVREKRITADRLHSPFQSSTDHPDYQYLPGDLRLAVPAATTSQATATAAASAQASARAELFSQIVIVARWDPIERKSLSIAFADGKSEFVNEVDAQRIWTASNRARQALGFHAVKQPKALDHPTTEQ